MPGICGLGDIWIAGDSLCGVTSRESALRQIQIASNSNPWQSLDELPSQHNFAIQLSGANWQLTIIAAVRRLFC
jgi:hypothetical protein